MSNRGLLKRGVSLFCAAMLILSLSGCSAARQMSSGLLSSLFDSVYFSEVHEQYEQMKQEHFLNSTRFYDELASDGQRKNYESLIVKALSFQNNIRMSRGTRSDDFFEAFDAVKMDCPELFFLSGADTLYFGSWGKKFVKVEYAFTQAEYNDIMSKIEKNSQAILSLAGKLDSVYEKALTVHDHLVKHITYEDTYDVHTSSISGALARGRASCQGYTQAFQYLMNRLGCYEVYLVKGDSDNGDKKEAHAWNYITLDDGRNYYVDVTWDDSQDNYLTHSYFCIDESRLNATHFNYKSVGNLGSKYLYFSYSKSVLNGSFANMKKQLTGILARALKSDEDSVEFYVERQGDFNLTLKWLFEDKNFFSCVQSAYDMTGIYVGDSVKYYYDEKASTINVILKNRGELNG